MKRIRLAGLPLVFTLSLVAAVMVVKHRRLSPENLTYTPVGPEVDAKAVVAKMFETNRPWLDTPPIWASYKLRRKLRRISLENVYRLRSLRRGFESQQSTEGPFTARWRTSEDLRVGAAIWTPLQGMFKNPNNYTVRAIGTTQWRGRRVLALEVNFFQPLGCEMGMGAGSFHYSYARFPAQAARILVEPESDLPLFIGTSAQGGFSAGQPYASSWEFDPDFLRHFRLETGANEPRYAAALQGRAVSRLVRSTAGLEQPLPDLTQDTADEAQDSTRPRVVSVFPPDGTTGIAPVTELRVRFDRPMEPLSLRLTWDCGGFTNCDFPKYDAERYEFSIPVCLSPGTLHQIVVNEPWLMPGMSIAEVRKRTPQEGFRSAERRLGCVFAWRFFTQKPAEAGAGALTSLSSEEPSSSDETSRVGASKAAFDEPMLSPEQPTSQLLDLLAAMKRERLQIIALSERVQELSQTRKGGWFVALSSTGSTFKWQSPQRCFGDVSDIMGCTTFRIGGDAEHCWMEYVNEAKETVEVCPSNEVGRWELSFCDPFDLTGKTPEEAVSSLGLEYNGLIRRRDEQWHLIESSSSRQSGSAQAGGLRTQWRIDPRTYLLAEILTGDRDRLSRTRFLYDSINQPLPTGAFAVPRPKGASIQPADALDATYTNRFISGSDGSDGRMSLRLGKFGPGRTSSSGLN
jgi:hypothetical protein